MPRGESRCENITCFPAKCISYDSHELHLELENIITETFLNSRTAYTVLNIEPMDQTSLYKNNSAYANLQQLTTRSKTLK